MHEAALAGPLLKLVLEECERQGQKQKKRLKVTRVLLRAGLLVAIEVRTMQGIFAIMAENTPAEGATLAIETEPMTGRCPDCAASGRAADVVTSSNNFGCPRCNGAHVDWKGGNELYIALINVTSDCHNEDCHGG